MTPGTLSSDLTPDRRWLLVHALDVADEAALVDDIKRATRRRSWRSSNDRRRAARSPSRSWLAMLLALPAAARPPLPDRILALDTLYINTIALLVLRRPLPRPRCLRGRAGDRDARLRRHRGAVQVPAARRHRRLRPTWRSFRCPDSLIAALLVAGAAFALVGSFGLAKLSDFYNRLHGPTKATTLGVGGVLIASALYFSCAATPWLHELPITLFLFVTAPVSAHLLVKAALFLARRDEPPPR